MSTISQAPASGRSRATDPLTTRTERAGFEPAMEFNPHTRLAGECLQPLGHLSLDRPASLELAACEALDRKREAVRHLLLRITDSCSSFRATIRSMTAQHPLSLRLGREGIDALEDLARRRGVSRAEAARQAITETAERERRRTGLAAEARALMADKGYVREAQDVVSLMEELRGPW
jgi:Ribbon-helix-helix protein, copG family